MSDTKVKVISQLIIAAAIFMSASLSLVCSALFYLLYWQYRALFDETGRYFDAETAVVYSEQSVFLIVPALAFLLLLILLIRLWWARRHLPGKP